VWLCLGGCVGVGVGVYACGRVLLSPAHIVVPVNPTPRTPCLQLTLVSTTIMFNQRPLFQAAVAVFVMFSGYIAHTATMPFLIRESVPQTFFDIINTEGVDVREALCGARVLRVVRVLRAVR
jgi:hypothetical protein